MKCNQLIEEYLAHLRDGFSCTDIVGGFSILTPFYGPDNDAIEVYIIGPDISGVYEVTDRGETLRYLNSFGVDFMKSGQRSLYFRRIVRSSGAQLVGDEITITARTGDLVGAVDQFVHIAREAASLSSLIRTANRPNFKEQVSAYLHQLPLTGTIREGVELPGLHGSWPVDFFLNGTMNVVIEAVTASNANYAQSQLSNTFMKFYDLRSRDPELRAYTMLDDQEGRLATWPAQELEVLREQATIVTWGDRQSLDRELVRMSMRRATE